MDHPADKAFLKKLKPLKTLGEVQALAAREGIKYHRGKGTLDAMQAPPELVKQIVALPPGEVFLLPAGEATVANLVRATRTSPGAAKRPEERSVEKEGCGTGRNRGGV